MVRNDNFNRPEPNISDFKVMSQLVIDTIYQISCNAQNRIDVDFKESINNFIYIVTKIYVILNIVLNKTDQARVSDRDFDSQMVLWQACNSLISSLQLIRQGYTLEPQILMRYSIENLAMVLSFYVNEARYDEFARLGLSGEKCVGDAKKLVKQIGPIYGLLSEIAHPSKKTLGYLYIPKKNDKGTVLIGGGITDSTIHKVKFNLAIINFLSTIFWSSTELIFNEYLNTYVFWEKSEDRLKWKPNSEELARYSISEKLFKEALEEQKQIDLDLK